MNHQLDQLLQNIRQLNSYDLSAILWSLNYAASSATINALVRAIPDLPPEGSGIETCSQYNEDMRNVDTSRAKGFLALKLELDAIAENHTDGVLPELSNTAEYMQSRQPIRATYIGTYNALKAKGQAPRVTLKQYVDSEHGAAVRNFNNLRSKISDAMQIADTIGNQCGDDIDVSEEFVDSLYQRLIPKLQDRWIKAEIRATNYRTSQAIRDEASASQLAIEEVLAFVGGDIPDAPVEDEAATVDKLLAMDDAQTSVASLLDERQAA